MVICSQECCGEVIHCQECCGEVIRGQEYCREVIRSQESCGAVIRGQECCGEITRGQEARGSIQVCGRATRGGSRAHTRVSGGSFDVRQALAAHLPPPVDAQLHAPV